MKESVCMENRPLIFISNDDGVFAKGINALIDIVRSFGDVFVVAPDEGHSGMSCAITSKIPIRATLLRSEVGLTVYSCTGTPVDCVKLALGNLLPRRPDLIIAGINHGSNAAVNVHYSGTMGIAIEGALNNIPSIGFSLTTHSVDADFSGTVKFVEKIVSFVLKKRLPNGVCLNVNIPDKAEIKGINVCRQAIGFWSEEFEERTDPHQGTYYWLTGFLKNAEPDAEDTDEYALSHGYISVVPCKIDITDYDFLKELTVSGKMQASLP